MILKGISVNQDPPAKSYLWITPKGNARFWDQSTWRLVSGNGSGGSGGLPEIETAGKYLITAGSSGDYYATWGDLDLSSYLPSGSSSQPSTVPNYWIDINGTAGYVKYQHTNEINFKNVPSNWNGNIWFNYRNGDTDAVDTSDIDVTYKFGNTNGKTTKTAIETGTLKFTNSGALIKNASDLIILHSNTTDKATFLNYGGAASSYTTYIDGNVVNIRYGTNHTSGIYLNSSGNVGIGTTSPANKFHISSATNSWAFHLYNKDASATTPYVSMYTCNGNNGSGMWLGTSVNSSSVYIANFRYGITGDGSDGTSALYVRSDGNVGIGTESPAYKLDVSGDAFIGNTSSTSHTLSLQSSACQLRMFAYSDGNCYIEAGNSAFNGNSTSGILYLTGYSAGNLNNIELKATTTHCSNNLYATGGVTALSSVSSDKRLKKNIKQFDAKSIIDKLKPVEFEWNKKANKYNSNLELNKKNYGLIAQNSDGIIDNLVFDLPDGKGYKGVRYEKLIPILLQAVKEQQKEIDELKQIIKKIKV